MRNAVPAGLGWTAAAASLGLCLAGAPERAVAFGESDFQPYYRPTEPVVRKRVVVARRHEGVRNSEAALVKPVKEGPKPPAGPLIIAVSIGGQHLTVYDNGAPIATSPVSTGMRGHLTPMGVFSVIQKDRYHHSNIYSNAPMPFMQRITWSGVAMHAGVLPGYPASHGCIRMPDSFAVRLWGMTEMGARVVVTPNDVTPYEFEHPFLVALATIPPEPEPTPPAAVPPTPAPATFEPAPVAKVAPADSVTHVTEGPPSGVIEPTLAEASVDGSGTPLAGGAKLEPVALKMATAAVPALVAAAEVPELRPPFAAAERVPVPPVKPAASTKSRGAISLFVSRKEGKLFVRKGFVPVFDTPITIEHREVPFGTHVFTAARSADGSGLRWLAVSLMSEARVAEPERVKGKRVVREEKPVRMSSEAQRKAAADALDRIQLTPEIIARIAPYLAPGASLLISDQGLGGETGKETDFIVVTR
jgi:hypothetical protein